MATTKTKSTGTAMNEKVVKMGDHLNRTVFGNKANNELLLAACLNPHPINVLLMGSPGTSKTSAVKIISKLSGMSFEKIQGTPNLDINKVLGPVNLVKLMNDKVETRDWSPWVTSELKFIDEFNRITPESIASLMEIMDTSQGVRALQINQHKAPNVPNGPLFATMNFADSGNNEVFPPMLDRFDICLTMNHPNAADLYNIATAQSQVVETPESLTKGDLTEIHGEIKNVKVSQAVNLFAAYIARDLSHCRSGEKETKTSLAHESCSRSCMFCNQLDDRTPASPRLLISMLNMAKSLAYVRGKTEVGMAEMRSLFIPSVRHRIKFKSSYVNGKFMNLEVAYDALEEEMKKRYEIREQNSFTLTQVLEDIKNSKISDDTKMKFESITAYCDNDPVYFEITRSFVKKAEQVLGKPKKKVKEEEKKEES